MKKGIGLFLAFITAPTVYAASTFDSIVVEQSCTLSALAANTVPYLNSSKQIASSLVTPTELGYLSGVTSSIQTQLGLKAPLASPSLTGVPTAPTASQGNNSTQIATTAYVDTAVLGATIPDATTLVKGKVKLAGDLSGTADLPTVPALATKEPTISAGTSSQYWRGDKSFQTLDTSVVPENGNFYFTNARVDTEFDTRLALKSTSNLTEGSNLYFTNARVDTEFDTRLATKSTSNLTEGSNLYFTNARAVSAVTASQTSQALYVAGDNGNDSNACTLLAPCKTIQHAITAANSIAAYYKQVVIYVSPHTSTAGYAENLTLSQQGVNLQCYNPEAGTRACLVKGTLSVQLDNTSGGANFVASLNETYVNGFIFGASTSGAVVNFTGAKYQKLVAVNCYFQNTGTGNSAIVSNNGFTSGIPSEFRSYDTTFENTSSTNPTVSQSAGRFWLYGMTATVQNKTSGPSFLQAPTATTTGNLTAGSACISSPGSLTNIAVGQAISDVTSLVNSVNIPSGTTVAGLPGTCSAGQIQMSANAAGSETSASLNFGGSSMIANYTQFTGQYQQTDNVSTATFNISTITSSAASCISTPSLPNSGYALLAYFGCNSSATNSITGSGGVGNAPGNVRFGTSGDIAPTVTQASIGPGLPQGEVLIGAGATTGTNVALSMRDGHIKAVNGTSPTTTLSSNAGTGGTPACTLTHASDTAGYISLKTGTASWATGVQCTINFNKTWTTTPVCVFSASNDAARTAEATQRIVFPDASTSAQTISAGVAFSSQVTATWHYQCMETN